MHYQYKLHSDWEEQAGFLQSMIKYREKNFHTNKKLQAEITEKFKNFKVEIEKILRSK